MNQRLVLYIGIASKNQSYTLGGKALSKVEPLDPIGSSYTGTAKLNSHLDKIETAFQNTLSLDGSTPNSMEADIDMNSYQLINLEVPTLSSHAATKDYVDSLFSGTGGLSFQTTTGDASLMTVKSTGSTVARTLAERFNETIDVKDSAGYNTATAATAFGAASTRALTDDAGTGVVFVPRGTIYDINAIASPIVNTGFLQISPRYKGTTEPSWTAAADFYGNTTQPSNVWMSLEGRVDRGSGTETGTQIGLYTGMIGEISSSASSYLKAPFFSRARQGDPSSYGPNIERDLVAIVGQGHIAAGNALGRVWGGYFEFNVEATADGLATGIEVDCFNSGTTQRTLNTTTTKSGMRIFASTGLTTSAIHIDYNSAAATNVFQHGISINPSALDATGYAFLLTGRSAVMQTGVASFGTATPRAGYILTLDSASSTRAVIISDGANESSLCFLDTGTLAASIGLNNSVGRLRIAYSENLSTPLFEFSQAGVLGLGGAVPSAGNLTNGLFVKNGVAPTVAPSGGVFVYCVAGILKVMNTSGVEFPLNL